MEQLQPQTPQAKAQTLVSLGSASAMAGAPLVQTIEDTTKITITLPTTAYFLSGIRDFTLEMVRNMTGFTEQWAFRFQSIVDELVNNAIEHGSQPGDDVFIAFIHKKESWLEIVVEDKGRGPSQKDAGQMMQHLVDTKNIDFVHYKELRGRGLPQIVAAWTDELRFEDTPGGGLRVIARKYLNKQYENIGKEQGTSTVLLSL